MSDASGPSFGYDFLSGFVPRIVHIERRDNAFWRDVAYEVGNPRTNFHVLAYVQRGHGRLRLNSRIEVLRPGTVFHFPPGVAMNITVPAEDPACFYSIQYFYTLVSWRGKDPYMHACDGRPLPMPAASVPDPDLNVASVFTRAYDIWSAAGVGYEWHARAALVDALQLLLREVDPASERVFATDAVDAAVEYVKTRMATRLDRMSVAEHVGLSPAYFSTAFRRRTGYSFSEYVRGLRIDAAKHYLRTTSQSVTEIAHRVGFRDPFHFSRVFRRVTGVPPRQFRGF